MKWRNLAYSTTFFITATITEWQPLLACSVARDTLLQDLEFYRNKYGCKILAYVVSGSPEAVSKVIWRKRILKTDCENGREVASRDFLDFWHVQTLARVSCLGTS